MQHPVSQRFTGFSMNGKFASGAAEQEEAVIFVKLLLSAAHVLPWLFNSSLTTEATMKAFLQEYGTQCARVPARIEVFVKLAEGCAAIQVVLRQQPEFVSAVASGSECNSSLTRSGREGSCRWCTALSGIIECNASLRSFPSHLVPRFQIMIASMRWSQLA